MNRLEAEDWGDRPKITVNEAADTFILEHCPSLRLSSRKRYGRSIAYLDECLGDKMLADVRSADLKDFETWRRSMGAAAPTVRRDLACLSSIYGFAAEKEWVDTNPVSAFLKARKKRGLRESPPRTRYLTRDEETKLLEAAAPRLRDAIVFAIYSGLRSEEQWSLTWDRVDIDRRQVEIPKEIAKAKRDRTAILLDPAVAVLRALPRHIKEPFVFFHGGRAPSRAIARVRAPQKDGKRYSHMLRGLKAAAKRAGIPNLIWHDLRRTHGCRLLQEQGWSMEMVRDQLGHSTSAQTERSYAFLEVDARRQMAARTITGTAQNGPQSGAASPAGGMEPTQKPAHRSEDRRL